MSNELKGIQEAFDKYYLNKVGDTGEDTARDLFFAGVKSAEEILGHVIEARNKHILELSRSLYKIRLQRPTEPKTKIAEGLKALAWTKEGETPLNELVERKMFVHNGCWSGDVEETLDALLAICDEVES